RHSVTLELPAQETWFEADELRLAQIVANLLTNAAKYTDEGGAIRIAAERQGEDIVIRVRDSGIGIEQEALDEIFRMFTRVKAASARPAGGLGIGLALAKGLVELHGGSIEARSDGTGKGSEFTVRLPAGQASGRASEPAPAGPADTADIAPMRRILIADDNRDAAESLGTLLELLGHEVVVTFDGEEALMKFAEFQPEVALLDLGMPGLSGTELARAIRHRPDGKKAILIAVTGWGQERDKQLAYDAGFDHHLTKPIDPKQLVRMLTGEREHLAL
ncbi:MAG TPA: ATP-binding protein, partial [Noviherbaspirillum sp.]